MKLPSITGDFEGNYVENTATGSGNKYAFGGAIYNIAWDEGSTNIGTISGTFTENSARTYGGAIANMTYMDGFESTIDSITADFTDNVVTNGSGGAIANVAGWEGDEGGYSYIGTITGDFSGNSASEYGGAIYNYQTNDGIAEIDSITDSTFTSNSAKWGGAISNYGTITLSGNTTFENNSASGATAQGGAIYTTKNLNFISN